MHSLTLTNIHQLGDYTHIRRYAAFIYNESVDGLFGNYEASLALHDNNSIKFTQFNVSDVTVKHNNGCTTYILQSADSNLALSIAFSELQDYHRFDVINFAGVLTLVYYEKNINKNIDNKDTDKTTVEEAEVEPVPEVEAEVEVEPVPE